MNTDLLAKLEEAESGSRDLDMAIAFAVGYHKRPEQKLAQARADLGREPSEKMMLWINEEPTFAPHYTRSVDAALSLVPEGWRIAHAEDLLLGAWDVEVREINSASGHSGGAWVYRNHPARAATFPLAICSAALRARAVMGGGK